MKLRLREMQQFPQSHTAVSGRARDHSNVRATTGQIFLPLLECVPQGRTHTTPERLHR